MASFASAFAGAGGSSRQQRRDGGGMSNPIHFQPPAVAVPRSTVVTDEKGKPVALHTVRVRTRFGGWGGSMQVWAYRSKGGSACTFVWIWVWIPQTTNKVQVVITLG